MRVKELFAFIRERYAIYVRRFEEGLPKPWTSDPILQRYRFCNVYRELDAVTVWIRKNWRSPYHKHPDLWFAMVVARLLNLPASLEALDVERHVLNWDPKSFKKILRVRKEAGERVFNGAYMIHADAKEGWLKTDYLAERVLIPMWKDRETVRPRKGDRLEQFYNRLRNYRDMGPFMIGQVIADTKYVAPLLQASDWWTWAAPGPGSQRGLNRVTGRAPGEPWKDGQVNHWLPTLQKLQTKIDPLLREAGMPRMCAQDLQNCLCEFDKYERVRLGEGRPKQLYPGV